MVALLRVPAAVGKGGSSGEAGPGLHFAMIETGSHQSLVLRRVRARKRNE
jgi:hypothetical protein